MYSVVLVNNQLDAQLFFFTFVYSNSLHVSSNQVLIRRVKRTNTTSGICYCSCLVCIVVVLCVFVVLCVYCCFYFRCRTARSQYPEGPATGHLDTGFSWFPCA